MARVEPRLIGPKAGSLASSAPELYQNTDGLAMLCVMVREQRVRNRGHKKRGRSTRVAEGVKSARTWARMPATPSIAQLR